MIKVGYAEGTCSRCGRKIVRPRPANVAVCDCWEYCPQDHGKGCYGTKMDIYYYGELANFGFSKASSISLNEMYVWGLTIKGDYLYAGVFTSPGKIFKIDIKTFSIVSSMELNVGENNVKCLIADNDYLYAGTYTSPGKVVRISLSDFTRVDALTLATGENLPYNFAIKNGFLYVALDMTKLVKIRLSDFTQIDTLTYTCPLISIIVAEDGFLYVGTDSIPGKILKINPEAFTIVDTLTLEAGENNVYGLAIHNDFLYAGLKTNPGKIVKINMKTFTRISSLSFSGLEIQIIALKLSNQPGFLCALFNTTPARLGKVDLKTFTRKTVTIFMGENDGISLEGDNNYIYFGTWTASGKIVRCKEDIPTSVFTPSTYGPIKVVSGTAWGDLEHPMQILRRCPVCSYHSAAKPQEVRLS